MSEQLQSMFLISWLCMGDSFTRAGSYWTLIETKLIKKWYQLELSWTPTLKHPQKNIKIKNRERERLLHLIRAQSDCICRTCSPEKFALRLQSGPDNSDTKQKIFVRKWINAKARWHFEPGVTSTVTEQQKICYKKLVRLVLLISCNHSQSDIY